MYTFSTNNVMKRTTSNTKRDCCARLRELKDDCQPEEAVEEEEDVDEDEDEEEDEDEDEDEEESGEEEDR